MLFASKHTIPHVFKVHGHVPLRALLLKDGDNPNTFVIFGKLFILKLYSSLYEINDARICFYRWNKINNS